LYFRGRWFLRWVRGPALSTSKRNLLASFNTLIIIHFLNNLTIILIIEMFGIA
jgi:hypothetical protein